MRVALKIILIIIILIVALVPAYGIVSLVFRQSIRFDFSMLLPVGLSILGISSFIYHIKTVNFYKLLDKNVLLPKPNKIFWGLNLAFAASLILLAIWFLYLIMQSYGDLQLMRYELGYFFGFVGVPFMLGGIIFFEAYYTNNKIKQNKALVIFLEIDNIKGDSENQNL